MFASPYAHHCNLTRLGWCATEQARPLEVEKDMRPVIDFFASKDVKVGDVYKVSQGLPQLGGR